MTAAPYVLGLLGDDGGWRREVIERIRHALLALTHDQAQLHIVEAVPHPGDPAVPGPQVVVIVLVGTGTAKSSELLAELEQARDQACPVLPVVRGDTPIGDSLPVPVSGLNAMVWDGNEEEVASAVLRLFGLIERERKLFLSYRQGQTGGLAVQLRRALTERSYDVFLDRFSVPPAADFQRRLNTELADKAFVVLLESPEAVGSKWVQHEVAFALSHSIALLALTLPETEVAQQFEAVDEAFRRRVGVDELELPSNGSSQDQRVLGDEALRVVLAEIEVRYASLLRRRRAQLLGSLRDWLRQAGANPAETIDEWCLAADWPDGDGSVFLITPRAATPRDLHQADSLRRRVTSRTRGVVVSGAPVQDDEDAELVAWITEQRPLEVVGHRQVPDLLGLQ